MLPQIIAAPIAEISTPAYRWIVRSLSTSVLLHSEMLSAAALLRGGLQNDSKAKMQSFDAPFSYQLLGNDPALLQEATARLCEFEPFSIDLNLGCSAPDIRKRQQGAWLLQQPELVKKLIRSMRSAARCKLSAKIRVGYDEVELESLMNFVKMLEDEGCDFITVHPRTAKQGFRRLADWNITKAIREELRVPVVGNGDIATVSQVRMRLKEGFADSIMIARAAVQKPWIFREFEISEGHALPIQVDLFSIAATFVEKLVQFLPEELLKSRARRFFSYYCKNFRFGHPLFAAIKKEHDPFAMLSLLERYVDSNPNERIISLEK